jgi:hypothetical protein
MNTTHKEMIWKSMVLFVLLLFVNIPIVSALEISNVNTQDVTDRSANIVWETDEQSTSFVEIGTSANTLERKGDALPVTNHAFPVDGLAAETTYVYSVQSDNVVDDNDGNLYTFTTLPLDVIPPEIVVDLPTAVKGNRIDISGTSEAGATILVTVNGQGVGQKNAENDGSFAFPSLILLGDAENIVVISATDAAENTNSIEQTIFADASKPKITIQELPASIEDTELTLKGTISENSSIIILLNNESVAELQGTAFEEDLRLQEGENIIIITAIDAAKFESTLEIVINSDTRAPSVQMTIVNGNHFFEGRAQSDINGETEPAAKVYLYVFRSQTDDYTANFDRALASTTADINGTFSFEDVEFPPPVLTQLSRLAPRKVPAGLEDVLISPLSQIGADQQKSFKIYVIAEDSTGKTGYAQQSVQVSSCSSGDFAFDINPLIEFQTPLRLKPNLLEEGREQIAAVFNLTYRGQGLPASEVNPAYNAANTYTGQSLDQRSRPSYYSQGYTTNEFQEGYRINSVRFDKACTRNEIDDDEYKLGCQLLPNSFGVQPSPDKKAYYITANLKRADDFIEAGEGTFEEYVDKHHLKFPLKASIRYQERKIDGSWSTPKTQVFCHDMGYFVDVEIQSEDLVPDFLIDEGLPAINYTITQIENVKPYLETVMLITGVGCVGGFLTKMITRLYRNFISSYEFFLSRGKGENEPKCPSPSNQMSYYLQDTIGKWNEISRFPNADLPKPIDGLNWNERNLDEVCPQTAKAWKTEAFFDKAYRWTCDRFLCRAVPARWTESKTQEQVQDVVVKQQQCAVTSSGIPLIPVENCQEKLKDNPANRDVLLVEKAGRPFTCYKIASEELYYYRVDNPDKERKNRIWTLKAAAPPYGGPIGQFSQTNLLAYLPERSTTPIVGKDQSCNNYCKERAGNYQAADDGYTINGGPGCYRETATEKGVQLFGKADLGKSPPTVRGSLENGGPVKVQAGYTRDCFVNQDEKAEDDSLYQCVCEYQGDINAKSRPETSREALPVIDKTAEEWSYRQDRIYSESRKTRGTDYPKWRYYDGRDFSGAFGTDYVLDSFKSSDATDYATTKVDPHTQIPSTFQSMCVPGIYARLQMLESTLLGFQKCITEAKYTGFHDAGLCKTLFSQYVCGMIYKGIAYLGSQCSPITDKDLGRGEGEFETVEAFFSSAAGAVPQTLESSIQEVRDDYGNAHLENFFQAGSQGFAESICLAAFGYDFPMNMDFIQDTAYSFSTSVDVIFPIAERELTSFNPVKGTAVYDYTISGVVFPGCKVRGYTTELKCVDRNDQGRPNVDCSNGQCDCLQTSTSQIEFAGERTRVLESGTSFSGITKGQMLDLPIENPNRISSNYRYDHVVFRIQLDQGEKAENCFEPGYRDGASGGLFYFPIRDIGGNRVTQCQVRTESGRFVCPTVQALFGESSPYFEFPYMQCYDDKTQTSVPCDTPNIFTLGKEIVIKPKIYLTDQKACLRIKDTNNNLLTPPILLPEGQPGPHTPTITLGTVTPDLVGGGSAGTIVINRGESDQACGVNSGGVNLENFPRSGEDVKQGKIAFKYTPQYDGRYQVVIPKDVTVGPDYRADSSRKFGIDPSNRLLKLGDAISLTAPEVNAAKFASNGFEYSGVIGTATPKDPSGKGICTYQYVRPGGGGRTSKFGALHITAELLRPGPGDSCFTANQPIGGRYSTHRTTISLQSEPIESTIGAEMDRDFENRNYNLAIAKAQGVVNRKEGTVDEAVAIYYWVSSLIKLDEQRRDGVTRFESDIKSLLTLFFERDFNGEKVPAFAENVKKEHEWQNSLVYLCEIDKAKFGTYQETHCKDVAITIKQQASISSPRDKLGCEIQKTGTHSCQDTTQRTDGNNDCLPNLCENSKLIKRGFARNEVEANNWLCCQNPESASS